MLRFQPKAMTRWGYDTVALYTKVRGRKAAQIAARNFRRQGWTIDTAYPNRYGDDLYEIVGTRRATVAERAAWCLKVNPNLKSILAVSCDLDGLEVNAKNLFAAAAEWVRWQDRNDAWAEEEYRGV